jgi:hypothetical protein
VDSPREIYGVDFSGAKDAGLGIWVARGVNTEETLVIEECQRGDTLQGSAKDRETCLKALVSIIKEHPGAAFGFDFPFGLPAGLVAQETWKSFILAFPRLYKSPDHFRESCFTRAGKREMKRMTEGKTGTPFASYNLRVYKQMYFGINEILFPLVVEDFIRVLPMQKPSAGKAWVMEVCPASVLKSLGLYNFHYKGKEKKHRLGRERILKSVEDITPLRLEQSGLEKRVLENHGGDALDSVIAAAATYQTLRRKDLIAPKDGTLWRLEGYVYAR